MVSLEALEALKELRLRGDPVALLLVETGGEWRWFFGSSAETVQQAIETYGQQSQPITEGDLIQNVVDDLDAFYADVLSYTPTPYHSPGVVLVAPGDRVNTACGPAAPGFYAFYCPPNETIYLEEAKLLEIGQTDDFIPAFVIAHEWAHHVQDSVGLERVGPGDRPNSWEEVYSIELELMADCMSGAWAQDLGYPVREEQLIRSDRSDLPGQDAFRFTHALIREAAYNGLPKQRRAEVHERVARWLQKD
jgi:predicted metalloprotease